MAHPIENRFCAQCGQPAVDARVEIDGSLTYLCAVHCPAALEQNGATPDEKAPAAVLGRRNGG